MKRSISPRRLVGLAKDLAGAGAGRGQPRNANLRRAASSAYYAVFHRLTVDVAYNALPGAPVDELYGVARHISHQAIKDVCEWVGGRTPPKYLDTIVVRLQTNRQVTDVAQAFLRLQEQRESADYDHGADFTRAGTLNLVGIAERAISDSYEHRGTETFRAFLSLILLRSSIGQRS